MWGTVSRVDTRDGGARVGVFEYLLAALVVIGLPGPGATGVAGADAGAGAHVPWTTSLTDQERGIVGSGCCPKRVNGTLLMNGGALTDVDISAQAETEAGPEWIWRSVNPRKNETIWTCAGMTVKKGFESATLRGSCDNVAEAYLNGAHVASTDNWAVPFRVDVTKKIQVGQNSLAAWGKNQGGPAALWLELRVKYPDGHEDVLATDPSWLLSSRATDGWMDATGSREGWKRAESLGELGVAPWGTASTFSSGSAGQALPAEELELLGARDYFHAGALCVFEWPSRGHGALPAPSLVLTLAAEGEGRRLQIEAHDAPGVVLKKSLKAQLES